MNKTQQAYVGRLSAKSAERLGLLLKVGVTDYRRLVVALEQDMVKMWQRGYAAALREHRISLVARKEP